MAQRYETYKDSGVQWLGEIPGHWKVCKFPYCTKILNAPCKLQSSQYEPVGIFPIVSQEKDLINGYWNDEKDVLHINNPVVIFGDHTKTIKYIDFDFVVGADGVRILSPTFDYVQRYYYYSLLSLPLITLGYSRHFKLLKDKYLPLPPLSEQHAIVSYLDDKCGKIDEWIAHKQKEVELLGEMKQRVIADAVTRGLNPNVKMKATNIPWLPEVPEHWDMSKVSSHFKQRNEKVSDKDYPALSVSKQGVTPQLDNVALSNAEGASRKLVKVGDYAVNSRSDRKGSCGISKYEGSVSLITIVLEPFDIDGEYVHYLFRSTPWIEEFYRNGRGIVADLWTTNFLMMKGMYFPIPPLSEQRAIVAYITDRTAKIDKMVDNVNREIENLKEYKQRLISDVVTGQIKVC